MDARTARWESLIRNNRGKQETAGRVSAGALPMHAWPSDFRELRVTFRLSAEDVYSKLAGRVRVAI